MEVIYRESPEKADRIRQLWDLLISLPDPEPIPITPPTMPNQLTNKNQNNHEKIDAKNV
jgi:hypothetical protein